MKFLLFTVLFPFLCSCAKYPIKWQRSSVNVTQESIEEVLDWIYELPCAPAHDELCTIEALVEATEDEVQYTHATCLFSHFR